MGITEVRHTKAESTLDTCVSHGRLHGRLTYVALVMLQNDNIVYRAYLVGL